MTSRQRKWVVLAAASIVILVGVGLAPYVVRRLEENRLVSEMETADDDALPGISERLAEMGGSRATRALLRRFVADVERPVRFATIGDHWSQFRLDPYHGEDSAAEGVGDVIVGMEERAIEGLIDAVEDGAMPERCLAAILLGQIAERALSRVPDPDDGEGPTHFYPHGDTVPLSQEDLAAIPWSVDRIGGALARASVDADEEVSQHSAYALLFLHHAAIPIYSRLLRGDSGPSLTNVVWSLRWVDASVFEARDAALEVVEHPNAEVRQLAIQVMERVIREGRVNLRNISELYDSEYDPSPSVLAEVDRRTPRYHEWRTRAAVTLARFLEDQDDAVREAALDALYEMLVVPSAVFSSLVECVANSGTEYTDHRVLHVIANVDDPKLSMPLLIDSLRGPESAARAVAEEELIQMESSDVVADTPFDSVVDADSHVRRVCRDALVNFGSVGWTRLVAWLSSETDLRRHAASYVLVFATDRSERELLPIPSSRVSRVFTALSGLVDDRDPVVRKNVIATIANLGSLDSDARALVMRWLESGDPLLREMSVRGVSLMEDLVPSADEIIVKALEDDAVTVRGAAARALRQIKIDVRILPALTRLAERRNDARTEIALVKALGRLGTAAVGPLEAAFREISSPGARREALSLLGRRLAEEPVRLIPLLRQGLADAHEGVRATAVSIATRFPTHITTLAPLLVDGFDLASPSVISLFVYALVSIGEPGAVAAPLFLKRLETIEPAQRYLLVHALTDFARVSDTALRQLVDALEVEAVRKHVEESLWYVGSAARSALPRLRELRARDDAELAAAIDRVIAKIEKASETKDD